jgi:hypothetical protein
MNFEKRRLTHFLPEQVEGDTPETNDLQIVVDPEKGRIVKTGDPQDVRLWLEGEAGRAKEGTAQPFATEQVEGGAVMAGLTDAHMHPVFYAALTVKEPAYLFGMTKKEEVVAALKRSASNPERQGKSILGIGLDTAQIPDLTASDIKEAVGDRQVLVADLSFHGGVVSSPLASRVEAATAAKNLSGHLMSNGSISEQHLIEALKVIDAEDSIESVVDATEKNLDGMLKSGITSVHDMLPMTSDHFVASLHLRKKWARERGIEFPIRRYHLDRLQLQEIIDRLPEIERLGLMDRSEFPELVGLKLLADGSFGSHTAMMSEDYTDGKGRGAEYDTVEQMNEAIRIATDHGLNSVAIHAIGDAGIQRAVATARRWVASADSQQTTPTFRIEHFELPLPREQTLKEVRELGIWVTPQPNFLLDYVYEDRLGDRTRLICPHRALLDEKVNTMFGTDGMPRSMLFAIYLATHAEEKEQRLTFTEALLASSLTAAQFEKDQRGSLREGNKADIIVADPALIRELSEGEPDVRQYAQGESANQKVAALESQIRRVYKAGQLVYQRAKS